MFSGISAKFKAVVRQQRKWRGHGITQLNEWQVIRICETAIEMHHIILVCMLFLQLK